MVSRTWNKRIKRTNSVDLLRIVVERTPLCRRCVCVSSLCRQWVIAIRDVMNVTCLVIKDAILAVHVTRREAMANYHYLVEAGWIRETERQRERLRVAGWQTELDWLDEYLKRWHTGSFVVQCLQQLLRHLGASAPYSHATAFPSSFFSSHPLST